MNAWDALHHVLRAPLPDSPFRDEVIWNALVRAMAAPRPETDVADVAGGRALAGEPEAPGCE